MKVKDLRAKMAERQEHKYIVKLGNIDIADDASTISIGRGSVREQFLLDDQAIAMVGRYLKIPAPYLKNCPPEFRAETLRFWRDKNADADTILVVVNNDLVAMYSPHLVMIPVDDVIDMIEMAFHGEDEVRTFLRDENIFHVDITSADYAVDIDNPRDIPNRPDGSDITYGGVRLLAYPNQIRPKPPVVATYLHRVYNNGGMVTGLDTGKIKLKGHTVSEILGEMEVSTVEILRGLDAELNRYAQTAHMDVPGDPLAFAMALARENSLPVRVRDAVTDLVNQLPSNATVFDVNQCFITVASRGVKYNTQVLLQEIGGRLALDAKRVVERCSQCEQLLPS